MSKITKDNKIKVKSNYSESLLEIHQKIRNVNEDMANIVDICKSLLSRIESLEYETTQLKKSHIELINNKEKTNDKSTPIKY